MSKVAHNARQLRLFQLESGLAARLGAEFFRALPAGPGVYFFHGRDDALLYIGQSADLRARIGSYRHVSPEKNPRRTLRLVARTVRIEWECCESPAAAIERERVLLLERRPPFNRAGVWPGTPWWLTMAVEGPALWLRLQREATPDSIGPLPAWSRYWLGSLVRGLLRMQEPARRLTDFPAGLMGHAFPRECCLALPDPDTVRQQVQQALKGETAALLAALEAMPAAATETERTFWQEDRDQLQKYAARLAVQV